MRRRAAWCGLPPDVRKGSAFPGRYILEDSGEAQPRRNRETQCDGKPKAFRTSNGEAVCNPMIQ